MPLRCLSYCRDFDITESELQPFWPDKDALIFDCLRHHGQQIDVWQRQVILDETLTAEQKLLARYDQLAMRLEKIVFPGCLFCLLACVLVLMSIHKSIKLSQRQKKQKLI